MEICSVTLKNFKTHADSHFEFCPGTNAICGENGAGKTTILEAIAWTLFDHSDYTRGELIRTGAKSAQVAVSFISHLDERQYEVRRCTSRGYTLYDLQLNSDLGIHLLEDVQQWMRAHLGVPPQTDLARLFAETIGIPQGTFTTDFLRRPNDRKKIFDPILKVEEYKQTYTQMRDLETYARAQVSTLSQQLAHYEQQLADWADLQEQHTTLKTVIATDAAQIADLDSKITQHQQAVEKLTGIAQQVQTLESQSAQLTLHLANKSEALQQLEVAWQGAKAAVELCRAKRPAFQAYEEAQAALKTLSEQRRQQQAIAKQREDLRQTLSSREAQVSQLQGQMATFTELEQAVAQWQALVPDQDRLEQQRQETSHALQQLAPLRMQHQTLQSQLAQRQAQHTRLQTHVAELEQWAAQPDPIPQLEQTQHHLQTKLSQIEAGRSLAVTLQSLTGPARKTGDRYQQQVKTAQMQLEPLLTPHPDLRFVQQVLESGVALHGELLQSFEAVTTELTDPAAAASLQSQLQDAV
ncbi:MAG TPA: SMC family ATPase, partial [Stenomitos sp.]